MAIHTGLDSSSTSEQNEKPGMQHVDLTRELTVQPLPEGVKVEGGLLLDVEGLSDQTSLRLAPDGHVSQPSLLNLRRLDRSTDAPPDRASASANQRPKRPSQLVLDEKTSDLVYRCLGCAVRRLDCCLWTGHHIPAGGRMAFEYSNCQPT